MVRELMNKTALEYDSAFTASILRADVANPSNPMGVGVSYHGDTIIGKDIGATYIEKNGRTGFTGDAEPYPGNLKVKPIGDAVASLAYFYKNHLSTATDSTMGISIAGGVKKRSSISS